MCCDEQQGSEIIVYCFMPLKYMGCNQLCSFAPGVLHGAASSKAPVLLGSKFCILIAGCLQFSILLRMNNQKELSALCGVLNEIVQSLINAGVEGLLYQLALDYLKGALFWQAPFGTASLGGVILNLESNRYWGLYIFLF